jgi:hypothetical protein
MMNYHDKSVEDDFLAQGFVRTHPWTTALSDESEQYYDFIKNPELIETSLEDFIPYDKYPAIKTFYKLLRWLNGPDSIFESNDCALAKQIAQSSDRNTPLIEQQNFRITGRLMFFYREHILNAEENATQWLWTNLPKEFDNTDPKFKLGVVGYSKVLSAYSSLPEPLSELSYDSVCLTFYAWGLNEVGVMNNLNRLFTNTLTVLKRLSQRGVKKQFPEQGRALLKKVEEKDAETLAKLTTLRQF